MSASTCRTRFEQQKLPSGCSCMVCFPAFKSGVAASVRRLTPNPTQPQLLLTSPQQLCQQTTTNFPSHPNLEHTGDQERPDVGHPRATQRQERFQRQHGIPGRRGGPHQLLQRRRHGYRDIQGGSAAAKWVRCTVLLSVGQTKTSEAPGVRRFAGCKGLFLKTTP